MYGIHIYNINTRVGHDLQHDQYGEDGRQQRHGRRTSDGTGVTAAGPGRRLDHVCGGGGRVAVVVVVASVCRTGVRHGAIRLRLLQSAGSAEADAQLAGGRQYGATVMIK